MVCESSANANTGMAVPYNNNSESPPDVDDDETDYTMVIHPGYRFCPLDDELVGYYLKRKITKQWIPKKRIFEVNIYEKNPEELSDLYKRDGEKECYFFTKRDRKYKNGSRPNRAAGNGYWKATGADKEVRDAKNNLLGCRKALVFYRGKPPKGVKTNWIMHEFRVSEPPPRSQTSADDMTLDDCVLCRIYKRVDKGGSRNRPRSGEREVEEAESENDHEVLDQQVQPFEVKPTPPGVVEYYSELEGIEPFERYNNYFGDHQTNISYEGLANPALPHNPSPLTHSSYYDDFGMGSRLPVLGSRCTPSCGSQQ